MRPSSIMQYDDPMKPKVLREIVAATGAQIIDYDEEVLCCGTGAGNADPQVGLMVLKQKMDSIKKSGADAIVAICPSCFQQLDGNQKNVTKQLNADEYDIPVLYLTELLALAMGEDYDSINLKMHRTRPKDLMEKL
jgi:heterodisulfide reductase subunit B